MKLFLSLLFLFVIQANAKDYKVTTVKNDGDNAVYDLFFVANEKNEVTGVRTYEHSEKKSKLFDIKDLKEGILIRKMGSYRVMILKSQDFNYKDKGQMTLNYLSSGILGSRKDFKMDVSFEKGQWKSFSEGKRFQEINLKVRWFFGQMIGIKSLSVR